MVDVLNYFLEHGKILEADENKMVVKWRSLELIVRKVNEQIVSISGAIIKNKKST